MSLCGEGELLIGNWAGVMEIAWAWTRQSLACKMHMYGGLWRIRFVRSWVRLVGFIQAGFWGRGRWNLLDVRWLFMLLDSRPFYVFDKIEGLLWILSRMFGGTGHTQPRSE